MGTICLRERIIKKADEVISNRIIFTDLKGFILGDIRFRRLLDIKKRTKLYLCMDSRYMINVRGVRFT